MPIAATLSAVQPGQTDQGGRPGPGRVGRHRQDALDPAGSADRDRALDELVPDEGEQNVQLASDGQQRLSPHDVRPAGQRSIGVAHGVTAEDLDHPREEDEGIVTWLNENGAKAEFIWLADRGITGNGHMMMLEENSDEIADLMLDWADTLPGMIKG